MTSRQKFAIACLLVVSALLVGGYVTAEQWLPAAQSIIAGGSQ